MVTVVVKDSSINDWCMNVHVANGNKIPPYIKMKALCQQAISEAAFTVVKMTIFKIWITTMATFWLISQFVSDSYGNGIGNGLVPC